MYISFMDGTGEPGGKRARTRAALVEAAAAVIAERGYERTSLEAVATRAGMTRGAIYGNFRNKEELFLAVVAAKWQPILPAPAPGAGFREAMHALAEAVVAALPARRGMAVQAASFQLYALTHPAMQARVAAANAEIYARLAAGLAGAELPMPEADFVRVMHAVVEGVLLLHALTPELVDDRVVRAAFRAFTG